MMGFLSKLNVASWGLAVGAGGQAGLYKNLFPEMPTWAILVPLVLRPSTIPQLPAICHLLVYSDDCGCGDFSFHHSPHPSAFSSHRRSHSCVQRCAEFHSFDSGVYVPPTDRVDL